MNTLLILGIAHVIGDYLLQGNRLAKDKEQAGKPGRRALLLHALLYAAAMGAVFLCAPFPRALLAWGILALSHGLLDFLRVKADRKWSGPRARASSFCLDQLLHLGVILLCWALLLRGQRTACLTALAARSWFRLALLYAALLCGIWKPTAVLVSKVLAMLPPPEETKAESPEDAAGPAEPDRKETEEEAAKPLGPEEDFRSGELIGKLERVIVAALVLSGAATAIGFVLTAKSVARFKQMEDRNFAERYLVGTLLSVAVALTAALAVKRYL